MFMVGAFLILQSASAQLRKIPSEVTEAFKQKYSNASNVEWKDRLTSYVAVFQSDGKTHSAYFDDDGTWKHTETVIDQSELPAAVNDGFRKSKYTEWNVDRVERIDMAGGEVRYRVQVKKGDVRKKNLVFNSEGQMMKDKITV